jgi:hypothetical protein
MKKNALKDIAKLIVALSYRDLKIMAAELHEMNNGENKNLRDMTVDDGMASTLYDWADATMEEV